MDVDISQTASAVVPYVVAAVQTYGQSTLDKARDTAIDRAASASATWGRRLLARLVGGDTPRPGIESAVADLAAAPEEADAVAALRLQIRTALDEDAELRSAIGELVQEAQAQHSGDNHHVTQNAVAFGNSKQAVLGSGVQNVSFGE